MPSIKAVVIIDDSHEDRFFLRRALRRIAPDCEVVEFPYADEALSFMRSPGRPLLDLIFVDINMPRMDGFEFVDAYNDLYPELKGDARVVVMSSSINPADRTRADGHPAVDEYLEKPIPADRLAKII